MTAIERLILTEWRYVGLRDGECVAMALKSSDDAENKRIVKEWEEKGIEARVVHRDEMRWWHDKFNADLQKNYRQWRRSHPLRWLYYKVFGWPCAPAGSSAAPQNH